MYATAGRFDFRGVVTVLHRQDVRLLGINMAKVVFTAGRVSAFTCPADKAQTFLWDATAAGLGLRTTPAGGLPPVRSSCALLCALL